MQEKHRFRIAALMRRGAIPLLGLVAAWSLAAPARADEARGEEGSLSATYVFSGTVVAAASSSFEGLEASEVTYAVFVDKIEYQAGTFMDQTGRQVTVIDESNSLFEGEVYLFHTDPVLFGKGIAVRLITAVAVEDVDSQEVVGLAQKREDEKLRARLDLAEAVVSGTVIEVRAMKAASNESGTGDSEHSAELHVAELRVDRVLEGRVEAGIIQVLFAASLDVHWFRAPKLSRGDVGIFLLKAGSGEISVSEVEADQLTLFHPLDYQSVDRLRQIEELLP